MREPRTNARASKLRRGADAEAPGLAVRRGASQGWVVEVEGATVQRGRGDDLRAGRATDDARSLHTDYTFARVATARRSCRFAKAYSGLTDAEIRTLDDWIRRHTLEKFGPVRHVEPVQVFELAFEGIQRIAAAQVGGRGALSENPAVAHGQAGGGSGYARHAARVAEGAFVTALAEMLEGADAIAMEDLHDGIDVADRGSRREGGSRSAFSARCGARTCGRERA